MNDISFIHCAEKTQWEEGGQKQNKTKQTPSTIPIDRAEEMETP